MKMLKFIVIKKILFYSRRFIRFILSVFESLITKSIEGKTLLLSM